MTKFGVQLPNFSGVDPADLFGHVAGLATAAEDAGFDSVWVMDHCADVGRDPAEIAVTWMTPLIVTTSDQNTAEMRELLAASVPAGEISGFTVGQPHEIPGLVAGHIEAGADEVIFSVPFADAAAITAVADAFSLNAR
jgi:hypothetical protein